MATTSRCPSCQRMLRVPETLLGQDVRCPGCQLIFTAGDEVPPQSAAAGPTHSAPAAPPPYSMPTPRQYAPDQAEPRARLTPEWNDDYGAAPRPVGPLGGAGKATVALVVLILVCVADGVAILSNVVQYSLITQMESGRMPAPATITTADTIGVLIAVVNVGLFIVAVITVGMWIYQAHKNLLERGVGGKQFTPGWAVGWFFVPFANLFKPYQAMQELWKASDPAVDSRRDWRHAPGSGLVSGWWATWLIGNIILNFSNRIGLSRTPSLPELKVTLVGNSFGAVMLIVAAVLLICIIQGVQARQRDRFRLPEDHPYGMG